MEIDVPEGCSLESMTLQADSQERFDALVAEHEAFIWQADQVQTEIRGERKYVQPTAYWHEEGCSVHLHAPKRYVTVTVSDA